MSARCPYEVLEVEPGSSFAEIRRAYERVRAIFGPTSLAVYSLASPEEQRAVLLEIEDAYRILSDPETRRAHDREHGHPPAPEEAEPAAEGGAAVRPLQASLFHSSAEVVEEPPSLRPSSERLVPPPAAEISLRTETPPDAGPMPSEMEPPRPAPPPVNAPSSPVLVRPVPPATEPAPPVQEVQETVSPPRPKPPPLPSPEPAEENVETPAPEMPLITEDTVFTGPLLRAVREARRLTIRDIANRTKISPTHLESIEEERWSWLPARVFLRGFLISYARELKLDPEQVSRTFLERRERAG